MTQIKGRDLLPACLHLGQESVSVGVAGAGGGGHLGPQVTGVSLLGGLSVLHGSFCLLVTLLVLCSVSTLGMVAEVCWLHGVLTVLYYDETTIHPLGAVWNTRTGGRGWLPPRPPLH